MDPLVFILNLLRATGHAAWNSLLNARIAPGVATTLQAIGAGGGLSPLCVGGVTQAPIALAAALRESGVPATLVIGAVFLKKPLRIPRVVAAADLVVIRLA